MKKIFSTYLVLMLVVFWTNAQQSEGENYLIVLGSFSKKEHAELFSKRAQQRKMNTKVDVNKLNNNYYVYIPNIKNHDLAMEEVKRLRSSTPYKDAWAFRGTLNEIVIVEAPKKEPIVEPVITPVVEEKIPAIVIDSTKIKMEMELARQEQIKREREEQIKREVDSQQMKVKKGEMEVLDHIYFYKDAAILRPESRYQVDKLVKNMKDYPNEQIKIHGHTNGDAPGKIIRRKDANADVFSLENTIEDYGSAKELSEQRAELIRDYLVANGIDKKRMSIKAEGGNKPIYKIDDDRAEANVRVEIEIVKN